MNLFGVCRDRTYRNACYERPLAFLLCDLAPVDHTRDDPELKEHLLMETHIVDERMVPPKICARLRERPRCSCESVQARGPAPVEARIE